MVRRYGLEQKIIRARLDGLHRGSNIGMTGEKNYRQRRTKFDQPLLQFGTAQSRYLHIEEDAAWNTFARQVVQQMLRRSVCRACFS